jgi:peptidoglycan hydrolase-like protein with peptidoglycan-binding domain
MRKLIMATASVLALGIAGSGVGHAADPYNSSTTTPANPGTSPGSAMQTPGRTAAVNLSEDQIKAAQQQLKAAGLYKGTIDGKMGTETQQAIEQFQQKRGLPATGTLDEETMVALQGNNRSQAGSSVNPGGQPSSTGR